MNIVINLLKTVVIFALIAIALVLGFTISAYAGYLIGIVVAWAAGGVLTGAFGIAAGTIPQVFAWLFVLGAVVGMSVKVDGKGE